MQQPRAEYTVFCKLFVRVDRILIARDSSEENDVRFCDGTARRHPFLSDFQFLVLLCVLANAISSRSSYRGHVVSLKSIMLTRQHSVLSMCYLELFSSFIHRQEFNIILGVNIFNQPFKHGDPRTSANNFGMACKRKDAPFSVRGVEFVFP
jgi:hypothetical protein